MKRIVPALLIAFFATALFAQEAAPAPKPAYEKETGEKKSAEKEKDGPKDNIVTTSHTVTIGGEAIKYTARAGTMVMKDEDGKALASFFFVAYTKDGADPARRPITFTFNGGPGSSSVWLHMGAFGPRRVVYADDEGHAARPPYRTVDNESSLLDVTDLVFIDPVTTGFSRSIPVKEDAKYHGVTEDVRSVGEFIRLWTSRYNRWASPKFLAGESYGTTRAAGLAGWLHDEGYYLNGIVLLSSILNFQTARFDTGNDLPYILFLPTYTAIGWYHHRLSPDLQNGTLENAVAMSEKYALGPYTAALMQGDRITEEERHSVAAHLANLTGLSADFIDRANLRIEIERFDKELLRAQRLTVGRLDGRFKGRDRDAAGEEPEFDPSMAAIMGEYTGVFNDYIRRDLKFESDLPYEILTSRVRPWSFDRNNNRYLDVAETLRGAMAQNPFLHVFVANGYYDLATPFAATRYTFARMQNEPDLAKNVSMDYFRAGHMMYIDRNEHAKLKKDVAEFIRANAGV
jgi:carboxypeptidase C (cathepsin A)